MSPRRAIVRAGHRVARVVEDAHARRILEIVARSSGAELARVEPTGVILTFWARVGPAAMASTANAATIFMCLTPGEAEVAARKGRSTVAPSERRRKAAGRTAQGALAGVRRRIRVTDGRKRTRVLIFLGPGVESCRRGASRGIGDPQHATARH